MQFRHLINRGTERPRSSVPSLFEPRDRHQTCAVDGRCQRAVEFQLTLSDAARDLVFRPDIVNTDVRRVPMRIRYLRDKESLHTEVLQIRRGKLLPPGYFRRKLLKFRSLAAVRCSHINLYTLVFVYRKHFSLS